MTIYRLAQLFLLSACFPLCIFSATESTNPIAGEAESEGFFTDFIDDEDGKFDLSDFLAKPSGFLLVPIIITEPAVGYGGGLAAVFLQPREEAGSAGWTRPNISGAAALKTENGTEALAGFDSRYWFDGKLRSQAFAMSSSVFLDFYTPDENSSKIDAIRYLLDVKGGQLGLEWHSPIDKVSFDLAFNYFEIDAKLDSNRTSPFLPGVSTTEFSSIVLGFEYDSLDNPFTPNEGYLAKTSYTINDESLGATDDFQKLKQTLIGYWTPGDSFVIGLKIEGQAIFGDYPFYAKPFVSLRGVPAVRYQGESVLFGELEIQYILNSRWRVLGFAGTGKSWDDDIFGQNDQSVYSGGAGFRYRLARKFGMDVGIDVAASKDEQVLYLTFGSAWARP